jgi:hypothetical protein
MMQYRITVSPVNLSGLLALANSDQKQANEPTLCLL